MNTMHMNQSSLLALISSCVLFSFIVVTMSGNSPTFEFEEDLIENGKKFFALKDGDKIPYWHAMELLEKDQRFRSAFMQILEKGVDCKAYFFETPATTLEYSKRQPFEFILARASRLENVRPDPEAFEDYYIEDRSVVSFPNLGRDALLVAPVPRGNDKGAHLGEFMRNADQEQKENLWTEVGLQMKRRLEKMAGRNVWLSTSGLGIYWLHIRLDSVPKYYTYGPYKSSVGKY